MKVVCDACTAKYQIPDERVAGRKLKIRCRKCGGAIIIRGDLLEEASEPAPAAAPAIADEWHVSIDGDQHGPYTTDQMTSMLAAQQLDWDVFVWREGLADWQGALECTPLLEAAHAAGVHVPSEDEPTVAQDGPTSVVDRGDDSPTSMYNSDSFTPGDGLQPVARASFSRRGDSAPDQPAAVASGPSPASAFAPSGEPAQVSPRVSMEDAMTGERNEDSVLFSMGNLRMQAGAQPAPDPGNRAGYASGEGSGLIDIRALAALAGASQSPPPAAHPTTTSMVPPPGNGASSEDQLLRLANQTGAFATVDSLAPVDTPSRASSPAVPIAIFTGFAMIAAAVFGAIYLTRDTQPVPTVAAAEVAPVVAEPAAEPEPALEPAAVEQEEPAAAAEEPAAEEPKEAPTQLAAMVKKPAARKPAAKRVAKKRAPKATKKAGSDKAAKKAESEEKKPATLDDVLLGGEDKAPKKKPEPAVAAKEEPKEEPKAAAPPKDRSIDDLLDGAVGSKAEKKLPDSPTRAQVLKAIKGIMPAVKSCAKEGGVTGKATAAITVRGSSGKVSNVNVTGIQGPVGSCIARAVRKARFPQFAKPTFSINYPFKL